MGIGIEYIFTKEIGIGIEINFAKGIGILEKEFAPCLAFRENLPFTQEKSKVLKHEFHANVKCNNLLTSPQSLQAIIHIQAFIIFICCDYMIRCNAQFTQM